MTSNSQLQRPRLGFIGMGGMGSRKAGRLLPAEMSTLSLAVSRWLYAAGCRKGVPVLAAPVSGTTSVAEQGRLMIFEGYVIKGGRDETYSARGVQAVRQSTRLARNPGWLSESSSEPPWSFDTAATRLSPNPTPGVPRLASPR
jgi:6-phosphogluconate dehydrogenase-like protein